MPVGAGELGAGGTSTQGREPCCRAHTNCTNPGPGVRWRTLDDVLALGGNRHARRARDLALQQREAGWSTWRGEA